MFNLIKINELRQLIDPLEPTMWIAVDVPSETDPTGYELKKVSATEIGGGDNISNSDLTITDLQRILQLGGAGSPIDEFSIQDYLGVNAFSVNGRRSIVVNTQVTGSTGFAAYCNNVLGLLVNHVNTVIPTTLQTNRITTESSLLPGTGLLVSSSLGGSGTLFYQPNNGYLQMKPHGSNSPIPPTNAQLFGFFPNTTSGVVHPSFINGNGDQIDLVKQDLPSNPTNSEIAIFLSNIGFANLI